MWRYEVADDRGGKARWCLYEGSGPVVAHSDESFDSASNARRACVHFKANARDWSYLLFEDVGGTWRWHAKALNGAVVATSGESFASRSNAQRAATAVRLNAADAAGP